MMPRTAAATSPPMPNEVVRAAALGEVAVAMQAVIEVQIGISRSRSLSGSIDADSFRQNDVAALIECACSTSAAISSCALATSARTSSS
eukprot:1362620-Prymnesium_polylepis.1